VVDVFSKLIRLSYYSNVKGKVPEVYMQIFPPKPEPQPLQEEAAENGMPEEVAALPTPDPHPGLASPEEKKWAQAFIGLVIFHVYLLVQRGTSLGSTNMRDSRYK